MGYLRKLIPIVLKGLRHRIRRVLFLSVISKISGSAGV